MPDIKPVTWRKEQGLSQADIAARLGVVGRNPARTWQRWECGEAEPPIRIIVAIEQMSEGKVTAVSWMSVRLEKLRSRRKNIEIA